MAKTSRERVRAMRARRRRGRVVLKIEVDADDLREIAAAGYADAVSTDREKQQQAACLFVSDALTRRGVTAAATARPCNRTTGRLRNDVTQPCCNAVALATAEPSPPAAGE